MADKGRKRRSMFKAEEINILLEEALNDEEERAMAIIGFSASRGIPGGMDIHAGIPEEGDPSHGDLFYICRRRQEREHLATVVGSAAEASLILEEMPCSSVESHCAVEKTHDAVISRYYWPGMEADIRKWALNDEEERAMAIIGFTASRGIPGGMDIHAGIPEEGDPSLEQWQEDDELAHQSTSAAPTCRDNFDPLEGK
ncbi:unnamed protein product [Arctogadus glacialis]